MKMDWRLCAKVPADGRRDDGTWNQHSVSAMADVVYGRLVIKPDKISKWIPGSGD